MLRMYSAGTLTLEVSRRCGEEADLIDHRWDFFAAREMDRLAAVLDLECDQFFSVGLDGVGESEQRQRALARGRVVRRCRERQTRPSSCCRYRLDIIRNLEHNVGDLMGYIMTDGPAG